MIKKRYCIVQFKIYNMMGERLRKLGILIITVVTLISYTIRSQSITVTPSVTTINANSIYSFTIVDNNLVNFDGTIAIGFPSSLYSLTGSTLSCYNKDAPTQIYTCSVNSTSTVLITYTRSQFSSQLLSVSIATIRNPPSKQDLIFSYQFFVSGVSQGRITVTADPLTADSLVSCSATFSPSTVFTLGSATFNFTIKTALAINSSITITLPSTWNDAVTTNAQSNPIPGTTISCTPVTTSLLKTSLSCIKLSQSIFADSVINTAVSSNTVIVFSASSLRSPPTTSTQNKVTIQTLTPSGNLVDESSCAVSVVTEQALTLTSNTTFVVGEFNSLSFSWNTASPIKVNDSIIVTLPNNYMLLNSTSGTTIFYDTIHFANRVISTGNSSLQTRFLITSLNTSHSQISVGMKIQMFTIVVQNLIDSSSRQILVQVSRNNFFIASGSLTVTPNPNALTNVTIQSDNYIVSSQMRLNITFRTTNILQSSSKISIQIPSTIQLTGTSPTCSVSSFNSSASAVLLTSISCTLSSNNLLINSFLQNSLPSSSTISVIIQNALMNPLTTQPTAAFVIGTMSSANSFVDRSSSVQYTALPGTIANITIVPNSYQVLNTANYTITYTITRTIRASSAITIILPPQIQLSGSVSYGYLFNSSTSYLTTSPTTTTVNGSIQLVFSNIITTQLSAGSVIKIEMRGLINPKSLKPTSSFQVITSYGAYQIEKLTSSLTVTMTTLAQFTQFFASISSPTNGATKQYTFYIKPAIRISTGDILTLIIVDNTNGLNEITFPTTAVTCNIFYFNSSNITLANTCTVSGQTLTIVMAGPLTDTTGAIQYRLVVSSLVLARTFSTSSNFTLTSSTGGFGMQTRMTSSIVNNQTNNIQSISLSITTLPSQLNQYEQLRLVFKTFNNINLRQGQFIVITIPTIFNFNSATNISNNLCTSTLFTCSIYNNYNYTIKVAASGLTQTGTSKDFDVTLINQLYSSPTSFDFTTSYFLVNTYTNISTPIDKTDTAVVTASRAAFYLSCGGKCATCSSTNTSFCLTCYTPNTGVVANVNYGGFNTKTADGFCVDVCGAGYFNSSGSCLKCVDPCSNCNSSTVCITCITGFYYIAGNATCVSVCPTMPTISYHTYADSSTNTCKNCTGCYMCDKISTNCTACTGLFYLYQSQCIATCPDGFFQSTVTNKCEACDVGCSSTCQGTATNCTSPCKTGYFRPSAGSTACVNSCPTGSVLNPTSSVCECSSSCKTCSGTLTTCLTCQDGLFLYKNSCISQCPAQTYKPDNLATCLNCVDTNCSICNANQCLNCSSSYYLYVGTCTKSCPSGTRLQNLICVSCPAGCSTCRLVNSTTVDVDCTSCQQGYLIQGNSCVTSCGSSYINFNATSCVSACPTGYVNVSRVCELDKNNTNNSSGGNTTTVTTSVGRIVPFPYTITYVLIVGVSIGMRCLYPSTLIPSTIMSLGSIVQTMSAFTLIIVAFTEFNAFVAGIAIVLVAIILIYISNFISLVFIIKILSKDQKFNTNYKKKVSPNIIVRIISVVFYHKFHQIVFSNIFGIKVFCNKVDYVRRLYPFNVLLIISLFLSLLIVVGASVISYQVQISLLSSPTFIQSIDCILIVVLNVIPTILVLRRKDTAYEVQLDDRQVKRYETQDQLNMNNDSQGIEEVFIQQGGDANAKPSKVSQRRKNYYYQNSKRSQVGDDPYETPLDKKRMSTINPIAGGQDGQQSSQALFFGKTNEKNKSKIDQVGEDVQQIFLEEPEGDAQSPNQKKRKILNSGSILNNNQGNNSMINYTGYDLDPKLLQLPQNSEQFKKLPSQLKAKIRLAKANMQINKNSSNIKKDGIQQAELDQIQLSPKRNTKQKFGEQLEDFNNSRTDLLKNSGLKNGEKDKNRSKSKSIDKNRDRNKSKSPQKNKKSNSGDKQDVEQQRMVRNASEQMKKKQPLVVPIKTTKSQNIKKKKKKPNNQIKVLFNGNQAGSNKQQNKNQQNNDDQFQEQDEPQLPVFKQNKISNQGGQYQDGNRNRNGDGEGSNEDQIAIDSDGLNENSNTNLKNKRRNKKAGERYKRALPSERKSQNFQDQNVKNLRDLKGERTIPNQQPDDLPQLHSTQQIGNLVIVNRALKNRKSGDKDFSNDDSSIYKKIYNDQTQTLKSVQGDNYFSQQISPSHFNIQNQRFQETDASNDMPMPPTFDLDQQNQKNNNVDGFDKYDEYGIKRYSSNHNIDYDSVLSKRLNDGKIKQLEKIYLPRLQVIKPKRKKK